MSDSAGDYHHGNLRRALLDAAAEVIDEVGPSQMSLREVARRAGVSHAAPIHHFGDKSGLFTALAVEGWEMFGSDLSAALEATADITEVGVAYVRFAVRHQAHFRVMHRPDLYNDSADEVLAAAAAASDSLFAPAAQSLFPHDADRAVGSEAYLDAGYIAWSLAHGIATLLIDQMIGDTRATPDEREAFARRLLTLTATQIQGASATK